MSTTLSLFYHCTAISLEMPSLPAKSPNLDIFLFLSVVAKNVARFLTITARAPASALDIYRKGLNYP